MQTFELSFLGDNRALCNSAFVMTPDHGKSSVLVVPRAQLEEMISNSEVTALPQKGVYVLLGQQRLYVGQTAHGLVDINQLDTYQNFWQVAALFLSSNFDENKIAALKAAFIRYSQRSGMFLLENELETKQQNKHSDSQYNVQSYLLQFQAVLDFLGSNQIAVEQTEVMEALAAEQERSLLQKQQQAQQGGMQNKINSVNGKDLEVQELKQQVAQLQEQLRASNLELDLCKRLQVQPLQTKLQQAQQRCEQLKKQKHKMPLGRPSAEMAELQQQQHEQQVLVQKAITYAKEKEQEVQGLKQQVAQQQDQIRASNQEVEQWKQQLQPLQTKLEQAQQRCNQLQKQMQQMHHEQQSEVMKTRAAEQQISKLQNQQHEQQVLVQKAITYAKEKEQEVQGLKQQVKQQQEQLMAPDHEVEQWKQQLQPLQTQLQQEQQRCEQLQKQMQQMQHGLPLVQECQRLQQALRDVRKENDQLRLENAQMQQEKQHLSLTVQTHQPPLPEPEADAEHVFTLKGGKARMVQLAQDSFVLLSGAKINVNSTYKSLSPKTKYLHKVLLRHGFINDDFYLRYDMNFKSSSAAGRFVLGRSCTGTDEWRDVQGHSLNDLAAHSQHNQALSSIVSSSALLASAEDDDDDDDAMLSDIETWLHDTDSVEDNTTITAKEASSDVWMSDVTEPQVQLSASDVQATDHQLSADIRDTAEESVHPHAVFYLSSLQLHLQAKMEYRGYRQWILLKGSQVRGFDRKDKGCEHIAERFDEEMDRGTLIAQSDGTFKTGVDLLFDKASPAAKFVLGRSASGNKEWRNDEGLSPEEFLAQIKSAE